MYRKLFKRLLDIVGAVTIFLVIWPLLLISAILIKLDSPGPIIFKQKRLGRNGKAFDILKFRSMAQNAEHTGSGVYSDKSDTRVTRIGRILRATSIDELPQLINILHGDMSFIGPRPPLTYHPWPLEQYTDEQLRMFKVLPGITGWAQVHGRKALEWHQRIKLNVWYVDNYSFFLDVRILALTIVKVLCNADNENKGKTA